MALGTMPTIPDPEQALLDEDGNPLPDESQPAAAFVSAFATPVKVSILDISAEILDAQDPYASLAARFDAIEETLSHTELIIVWDGTGSQPLRTTSGTTDLTHPVKWRCPVEPSIGTGYAINGVDTWERTPS